ncbi:MAG: endonuclease/exonuclease/phosphatase family protein [Bacteroidota bacterium]
MRSKKVKKKLYTVGRYIIIILSIILIILSLMSLLYDFPYWFIKIIDFPRIQYFVIAVLLLVLYIILNRKWNFASFLLVAGIISSLTIHGTKLMPYIVGEKTVPDSKSPNLLQEDSIGILLANVLIDNKKTFKFLQIIKNVDPDLILVMEVNQLWISELQELKKDYSYYVEYPLNNAYGMAIYSKFELMEYDINFLHGDEVPSIHTKILMPSGRKIRFHGMHPVPPVPSDKYPDNVGEDELALVKVGKIVAMDSLPSIVAGDFNDVSWSKTSRMFEREGNLNNIRIGRGFYNSFNAKSLFLRWPLDHFFVTDDFSLMTLERLGKFNSDHFPIYAKLTLNEKRSQEYN